MTRKIINQQDAGSMINFAYVYLEQVNKFFDKVQSSKIILRGVTEYKKSMSRSGNLYDE